MLHKKMIPYFALVGEHPEEGALVDFQRRSSIPSQEKGGTRRMTSRF
jgi:hypothetical protein